MSDIDDVRRQTRALLTKAEIGSKYRRVFGDADGEDVLYDLLGACGLLDEIASPAHPDERSVAAGKRMIAQHLMRRMGQSEIALMKIAQRRVESEVENFVGN